MTVPFDTIQRERAGRGPMASLAIAPSCSTTIDANRKVRRHGAFSRGHHVHVVSNQPKKGFSTEPCPAVLTLPPVDWRRLARRPFPIHASARGVLLPRLSRKRVCSIPLGHTRTYSANLSACQPSVRNRLPHQRLVNRTADRLHHLSDLSSSPSFDGFQTIGKAFDEWTKTNFGIGQK